MLDPRITKLADVLVNYSCAVQPKEKVVIEATDIPAEMVKECVRLTQAAGGIPLVLLQDNQISRTLQRGGDREQWEAIAAVERYRMEMAQCYIGIRGNENVSEFSDVTREQREHYEKTVWEKVHQPIRINKTRWVVLRWPTPSMAQLAKMSTDAFEDFYFRACCLDYQKMAKAMEPLQERMQGADIVKIKGPGETDLTFSIKGIPASPCEGKRNIPDGEVYTAPVRESINGVIQYNAPTLYRGITHESVRFEFKNGKIVKATSSQTTKLNEVLDADEGARYCGEFAIGFHPYITEPMNDILFDEKIAGSIHLTPGQCYEHTSNGNKSQIHWDLVLIQRPEYGGGELWFDHQLIRKDGRFVPADLQGLNPEALQ